MIPLFVGYAMFVWYLAARYRRSVLAFACVLAAVMFLLVVSYAHFSLGRWNPELFIQGVQILLYPYTVVVGLVGLFIATLPHRHPEGSCPVCGYSMAGLPAVSSAPPATSCPECGVEEGARVVVHRPSGAERADLRSADVLVWSPPQGAVRPARDQDQPGHGAQQHPAQG